MRHSLSALLSACSILLAACPRERGDDDDGAQDAGTVLDAGRDAERECLGRGAGATAARACACASDCDAVETCVAELDYGVPGGLCLHLCETTADCPSGTVCDPDTGCLQECAVTADCRDGHVCTRIEPAGPLLCLAFCQDDADCPALGTCDRYTGVCGDLGSHPGDGDVGAACASSADCVSAFCGQGDAFPGGYCSAFCSVSRQGCPGSGPCFANTADVDDDMGHCLAHCEDDTDCRQAEGYSCGYNADLPDENFCGTS